MHLLQQPRVGDVENPKAENGGRKEATTENGGKKEAKTENESIKEALKEGEGKHTLLID